MMDHEAEHNRALELMPEYALGNLSLEERMLVEHHILNCPPCKDELQQYQITAEELPAGILLYEPRPDLKVRILARAFNKSIEQITAEYSSSVPGAETDHPKEQVGTILQADRRPITFWERVLKGYRRLSPAWGLASLVLIVILAVSNGLIWTRLNRLENSSQLRTVALQGTDFAPQAMGTIVISMDGEHGTLVVDALPQLDDTHEYQLWLSKDGARVSGGVFSVSKDGYGAVWVHAPDALASYQTAGITIEPVGGSSSPTGDKILFGDL